GFATGARLCGGSSERLCQPCGAKSAKQWSAARIHVGAEGSLAFKRRGDRLGPAAKPVTDPFPAECAEMRGSGAAPITGADRLRRLRRCRLRGRQTSWQRNHLSGVPESSRLPTAMIPPTDTVAL